MVVSYATNAARPFLLVITRVLRARPDVARERRPDGFPRSLRVCSRHLIGEIYHELQPCSRALAATLAATATALGASTAVLSQAQETEFEEIVVTGTRKVGQSPTETLSPVDLMSGELLSEQAAFDLTDGCPR